MPDQQSLRQSIGEAIKTVAGSIKGRDGMVVLVWGMWFSAFAWSDRQKALIEATPYIAYSILGAVALTVINDILRLHYGLRREEEKRREGG